MAAKIQLSEEELALVQNGDWLLTKNKIIATVYELFGAIAHDRRDWLQGRPQPMKLSAEQLELSPKISKGENYNGLPYVMLDYPRVFGKEDVFAIRTMFWWGHYFSITLHLKGRYKQQYAAVLFKNLEVLSKNDFYISIGEEEWRHEITEANYRMLSQLPLHEMESRWLASEFIKLSAKISLRQWNQSKELLCTLYERVIMAIGH